MIVDIENIENVETNATYTKEQYLQVVAKYSIAILPDALRDDKEIALAAVKFRAADLDRVSDRLQNDRDVVLAAVSHNGRALGFALDKFRDDKEVVLVAVQNNQHLYTYTLGYTKGLSEKSYNDSITPPLRYASTRLRDDKDVVLAAVADFGGGLRFASERLRDDDEVVFAAISTNGVLGVLGYASDRLRADRSCVYAAVTVNGYELNNASKEFRDDESLIKVASQTCWTIVYNSSNWNKQMALAIAEQDPTLLQKAPNEIRSDPDVIHAVICKTLN